ncbi:helix-turn-helix domain-containing protein [Salmonella enterica]|nr:helix-turn-helix domain-containing protein [Salmonella enterica]
MTGLDEAIKAAGNQRKLAKLIGIWPQTVNRWVKRYNGLIPAEYVGVIYQVTGVLPYKLRPDLHPTPSSGVPEGVELERGTRHKSQAKSKKSPKEKPSEKV